MDNAYELDLLSLKEGKSYEFDYHIGPDFFASRDNNEILGADVDVNLAVEKRHDSYMLEFDFVGTLEVPCDRCLDPVAVPVDTTYDLIVRHGEEFDDSDDNLLVIPENQTTLDLSGMIYDTLMLEIPLRHVHPDGECNAEMQRKLDEIKN